MTKQRIILIHPSGKVAEIKLGFSWVACFFGIVWALVNKLWLHCVVLFVVSIVLNGVAEYAEYIKSFALNLVAMFLFVVYMYVCGRYGNFWLHSSLLKRGYLPVTEKLQTI